MVRKIFFFTLSKIRPPSRDLQNAVGPDVRRSVAEIRDLKVGKKWLKTNFFLLFLKFVLPLGTSKMSSDPMPVRRRDTGPQIWKKMVENFFFYSSPKFVLLPRTSKMSLDLMSASPLLRYGTSKLEKNG